MVRAHKMFRGPSRHPENRSGADDLLRVDGATCQIGRNRIFTDLTLTVRAGERLHLSGPNGAGKTTVLRCIAGTLGLSGGTIDVAGRAAGSMAAKELLGVCIEPERGLYGTISGRQNLLFAARLRLARGEVQQAVEGVEEELGISAFAHEKVLHYSAGMRARTAIARALLGRAGLVLLDEPTRSLDLAGREMLWAALDRRRQLGFLITSHLPDDTDRFDRAVSLAGR